MHTVTLRGAGFRGLRSALRVLQPHGSMLEGPENGSRVPEGIHSPGGQVGAHPVGRTILKLKKKSFSHL